MEVATESASQAAQGGQSIQPGTAGAESGGALELMRSISVDLTCRLPAMELAKLYRGIEHATPGQNHRVIQFVSAYKGEGTGLIAFELATVAATMIGKRVLFIDTAPEQQQGAAKQLASALIVPLDALLRTRRPLNDVLVGAAGTNLFYAALSTGESNPVPMVNFSAIEGLLGNLRPYYDLIVIHSASILDNVYGTAFAKIVDGTILVLEAEGTRLPVARQAKRMIEENGGRLIGSVMNNRRHHIPRWLYRMLYARSGSAA